MKINIKRFVNLKVLAFLLLILIIYFNWRFLIIFNSFGIDGYRLYKDFIGVILSWPVAVTIISLIFIFKFSDSIKEFLENMNFLKVGPVEVQSQNRSSERNPSSEDIDEKIAESLQERGITLSGDQMKKLEEAFNDITNKAEEAESKIANQKEAIRYLYERAEIYEFAYLNLFLVYNSKLALLSFHFSPSTKDNFMFQFALPIAPPNPQAEKEAIFSVLLSNQLIEADGLLFRATEKGQKFLRYAGFIK